MQENSLKEGVLQKQNHPGSAQGSSGVVASLTLPNGGGAIKGIDEKFTVNPSNGTAGFSIPFPFSPSRNGFVPSLSLSYNSGSGNSIFGLGWGAEPPSISRRTDKKLPRYNDFEESDIFIFSGYEDLVPSFSKDNTGNWIKDEGFIDGNKVTRYKPRIEGGFARIEKITESDGNTYWKTTSSENVVSIFGKGKTSQLSDPENEMKVFRWFLEFSYDDKGNCFQFEYQKEDKLNVPDALPEQNRFNNLSTFTNVYLKRVKYCNKSHFQRSVVDLNNWEPFLASVEYLLELVLDYGDHNATKPAPIPDRIWSTRSDPFSSYRSGFEIRTYRICKRLLMFHHFNELGAEPCLVRSLDLEFNSSASFTFLKSITQKGFIRKPDGSYSEKSLPPVEFDYEPLHWNTEVKSLPKESFENFPAGLDNQRYQWIDLYREGLSGIISEQAEGWYYKSNSGDGSFDGVKLVSPKPSFAGLAEGSIYFQDVEGNGQKFLVSNDLNGYFEFSPEDDWSPFKAFAEVPKIDIRDPNIKLLDLDGDGKADILISEDEVFTCYFSKGKEGYESSFSVRKLFDEEKGPDIVFADGTQSISIADITGDGLMDIVRIRNGEIVYWPNLGYGKFGAKVNMSNAPVFDFPDHFNPEFLKLADLDGSGTTDLVYLGKDSFQIYFNHSGNSWSEVNLMQGINPIPFPKIDRMTNVDVIDLLGNSTACIVWSSSLPEHKEKPLQYIDLMSSRKPHIMTSYKNNLGKEVSMHFKPSTHYYLEDKKGGTPWITKLPFPVHCVSAVEVVDQISKTRFTTQYSYHHGYYDYNEREFRGFGRVDQTDAEIFEHYKKNSIPGGEIQLVDEGLHIPPVLTKSWYHTGAFLEREKIFHQFESEYYKNEIIPEKILDEPSLPPDLSAEEHREALRSCKGIALHVEVYSLDNTEKAIHPFTTAHHTCHIQLLQPMLNNKNAVFLVNERESTTYTYERNPADPRISHSMNLEIDEVGNVLKSAVISYGRKKTDPELSLDEQRIQGKSHIVLSENNLTNKIDSATDYHLPIVCESLTYELTGLTPDQDGFFSIENIKNEVANAALIGYHLMPTDGLVEKRSIEHTRTIFFKNDLSGPLLPGELEVPVLPHQSYQLALTPDLRDFIYGNKVSDQLLINEGKYRHFDDDNYWISSGTPTYDSNNFYQIVEVSDPFGFKTQTLFDPVYHFFIHRVTDELGNISEVRGFNYRTLSPYLLMDLNDNLGGARMDELGMVTGIFTMGKEGEDKGDFLDLNSVEISLGDKPSSLLEYELFNYFNNQKPNFAKTRVRETHHFESEETGIPSKWQISYSYSDGGGNEIMTKNQAEPGLALRENEDGTVVEIDTSPELRWIGNGRTVLNNKGKPVKQYEPFFSTTFEFEDSKLLVERGITPIIYYDSSGRIIKTDFPDGTFSKVEFDSWTQKMYDQNNTVLESQWFKNRIITPILGIAPEEITAANKTAAHANTPAITYLDSLGRNFLSVVDNAEEGKFKTIVSFDIEGNILQITDARGNIVILYKYDMLGSSLYQRSMDDGERWMMADVLGKRLRSWDSRNLEFSFEYDRLHRPVSKRIIGDDGILQLNNTYEKIFYGENLPDDKAKNFRGKPVIVYDTSGKTQTLEFDFKGNALRTETRFLTDYKAVVDWDNPTPDAALELETFFSSMQYDALNRIVQQTSPDQTNYKPLYNDAGFLEKVIITQGGITKDFVRNIDYNEKGDRSKIVYGNDVTTTYLYDKKTFRLIHLQTKKMNGDFLQDLYYTFDPVGNITQVADKSIPDVFFNNQLIQGISTYTYDALYHLKEATGREHAGQLAFGGEDNWDDLPFLKKYSPNSPMQWRNYTQQYRYDAAGNILQMKHIAGAGSWTRDYIPDASSNRLLSTQVGSDIYNYPHHPQHGFITALPHLQVMRWNFKEELQAVAKQSMTSGTPETTYYVYDGSGQRTRKITERQAAAGVIPSRKSERIYVGGIEIYREYNGTNDKTLERQTYHVSDDTGRIAMIETRTEGTDEAPGKLERYQFGNHVGSACIETDGNARVISYEEYHPFGTTSYQAVDAVIKAAYKRYRFIGMERDEESGLAYHTARYYVPWLGRWLSADPIGVEGGMNLYQYSKNNSNSFVDLSGETPVRPQYSRVKNFLKNLLFSAASIFNEDPTTGAPKPVQPPIIRDNATIKRDEDLKKEIRSKSKEKRKKVGGSPPPEKQNTGKRIANVNDLTHNYGKAEPVPLIKPDPTSGGKRGATVSDYTHNYGNAKPVTPDTSPTVKSNGAAKEILGEAGESTKFTKRASAFRGGLAGLGLGLQLWEAYQYSQLIDDVQEWGETYQKNYNVQLDQAMENLRGAVGGSAQSSDVEKQVIATVPAKPRRSRAEEARAALILLGRQLALARQRANAAPVEASEPEESSGSYGGRTCETVLNPMWSPTGIPFGHQPQSVRSCW